jgi:hypothetical protein
MSSNIESNKQIMNILSELHKTEEDYSKYLTLFSVHANDLRDQINKSSNINRFDKSLSHKFINHMVSLVVIHSEIASKFNHIKNNPNNCDDTFAQVHSLMQKSLAHSRHVRNNYNKMLSITDKACKKKPYETRQLFNNMKTTAQSFGVQAPNDFSTLFIKPIQRFPRYELLGRELVNHTVDNKNFHNTASKFFSNSKGLCSELNKNNSIIKKIINYFAKIKGNNSAKKKLKQRNIKTLDEKFKEVKSIQSTLKIPNTNIEQLNALEKRLQNLHKDFKEIEQSNKNFSHRVGNGSYVGAVETARLLGMYSRVRQAKEKEPAVVLNKEQTISRPKLR